MALAAFVLLATTVQAATSDHLLKGDVGHLSISWPSPLAVSTETQGDRVEIRASRPFPAGLQAQTEALRPLLQVVRLNDTATVLELRASPGVRIEAVVLDDRSLAISFWRTAAPTLGLRLGRHPDFERVVIEPVREGDVTIRRDGRRDGRRVTLQLPGSLGSADLARLAAVGGIERVATAGPLLVVDLAPQAVLRPLYVAPDRQVLDLYSAATAGDGAPPWTSATAASAPSPPTNTPPTTSAPIPATDSVLPGLPPEAARLAMVAPAESLEREPPPWTPPHFAELALEAERLAADAVELRLTWPEPVPAAVFTRGDQLWLAFAASNDAISVDAASFGTAARRFVRALREESHPDATLLRLTLAERPLVEVDRAGATWSIRLESAHGAPELRPNGGADDGSAGAVRAAPAPPGLLLPELDAVVLLDDPLVGDRLGVGMAREPTAGRYGAARFVGLRLEPAAQGAVWRQLAPPEREPMWTRAGLHLGIPEGVVREVTEDRRPRPPIPLIETLPMALDAPPTPVVEPAEDEAATLAEAPPIAATGSLTPVESGPSPELEAPPAEAAPGLLDLARFGHRFGGSFWEQRTALLQATDRGDQPDAVVPALELARLHIAHGLGPEAVSILADIPAAGPLDQPRVARRPLEGAALVLAGRHEEALDRLAHPSLEEDAETALWRGAALATLERWDEALRYWRRGEPMLAGYTSLNQAALAEHGIILYLQTGRIDEAFALLERLYAQALPVAAAERLRELEAMALERDGAVDEARTIWRALSSGSSPEVRARSLMALTLSDLEAGRITEAAAIDRLVADSVHWRGQRDEVAKRRRLAGLQHRAGRSEAALETLQQVLSSDPPAAIAAAITDDMTAIVESLFDRLDSGERSATATLLLYRRYAELVPPGAVGDARIETLARALSGLGLDDAAIDSLRTRLGQSATRDAGRAALGHALAELLARNGDASGALAALVDSTPIETIDDRLAAARRELFTTIGRAEGDLAAAAGSSRGGLEERARRAFDRADWRGVLDATAPALADLPTVDRLDLRATEIVLMAATAARKQGEQAAVERLVADYAQRLADPADEAVLRLLAGNARFSGAADRVLDEAESYTRTMRTAIAGLSAL